MLIRHQRLLKLHAFTNKQVQKFNVYISKVLIICQAPIKKNAEKNKTRKMEQKDKGHKEGA